MSEYIVKQGDYLSKLARENGFADYHTIWDHPNNAELKKKRQNPNVLFPGDSLFIPPRDTREELRPTQKKHRFVVKKDKLMLRLTIEDSFFKPIANAECELTVEGTTFKLVTDGKGKLEQEIPADAQKAELIVKDKGTPINDQIIPIQIGHLDPVEEISGQKARLNNLGYFAGPLDKEDKELFRSAVEEFQCEHMGTSAVDGKCGPKTQAKLKEVHGC
jgi:N-acetylmuramoyl-L-alanine amidase